MGEDREIETAVKWIDRIQWKLAVLYGLDRQVRLTVASCYKTKKKKKEKNWIEIWWRWNRFRWLLVSVKLRLEDGFEKDGWWRDRKPMMEEQDDEVTVSLNIQLTQSVMKVSIYTVLLNQNTKSDHIVLPYCTTSHEILQYSSETKPTCSVVLQYNSGHCKTRSRITVEIMSWWSVGVIWYRYLVQYVLEFLEG